MVYGGVALVASGVLPLDQVAEQPLTMVAKNILHLSLYAKDYLPKVTLEHMLTMTSGLESSLFFCDWPERYTTPDWIEYFFKNAKFTKEPGFK